MYCKWMKTAAKWIKIYITAFVTKNKIDNETSNVNDDHKNNCLGKSN